MRKHTSLVWLAAVGCSMAGAGCLQDGDASEAQLGTAEAVQAGSDLVEAVRPDYALPPDPIVDLPAGGPTVNVWPPHGARFVRGAKFDIRVEGTGTGPDFLYAATTRSMGFPRRSPRARATAT